jgi:hypothetical protein
MARSLRHQTVGKCTGSGLHYLEPARFRILNGMASSIIIDVEPPSPTSGSLRSIFRQPPTNPIVRSRLSAFADRIEMRSRDGRDPCRRGAVVPSHGHGLGRDLPSLSYGHLVADGHGPCSARKAEQFSVAPGGRGWSCLFSLVMSWPRRVRLLERRPAPLRAARSTPSSA